jgi:hypothetical protein
VDGRVRQSLRRRERERNEGHDCESDRDGAVGKAGAEQSKCHFALNFHRSTTTAGFYSPAMTIALQLSLKS